MNQDDATCAVRDMKTASIFAFTIPQLREYFKRKVAAEIPDGFVCGMSGNTERLCVHLRRELFSIDKLTDFLGTTNCAPAFGKPRRTWMPVDFRSGWVEPHWVTEMTFVNDAAPNSETALSAALYREVNFDDLDLRIVDPPAGGCHRKELVADA